MGVGGHNNEWYLRVPVLASINKRKRAQMSAGEHEQAQTSTGEYE